MPSLAPPFDLALSEEVRLECLAFLQRAQSLTLSLMKGRRSGELVEQWSFAAHGPEQLQELEAHFSQAGLPLLHEIGGMVIAIPQPHLLPELKGRTLTRQSTGLVLVDRSDGL